MQYDRETEAWFVRPGLQHRADLRLFCFSHAGGAASAYHTWGAKLDEVDVWAVQLPGREGRISEPLISDLRELRQSLAEAMAPRLDCPYAFFGHSMGAVVAYETARELQARGAPMPVELYVSGRPSPNRPLNTSPLHPLPDDEFIKELGRRFGGLPAAILAEPDLMAMFLPILRSDLTMLETHEFIAHPPLNVPISAYSGLEDHQISEDDLLGWRHLTTSSFRARRFPGGHFFLHEQRKNFLEFFTAELIRQARKH